VGAGLAGLAAAHRLRGFGYAVSVLEARALAGGKHAAEPLGELPCEAWPAFVPRGARAYTELCAELGLAATAARAPLARVGWLRGAHVHTSAAELRDAMGWSPLTPLRLRRLVQLASWLGGELDPEVPERTTRLDDRSVADFCRVYLGRRVLERLLAPLFATCFGLDAANTSRELLFALLDARAGVALDLVAEAGALVEALATNAGSVRLGAKVAALEPDGSAVRLESGEYVAADAIVLAVGAREAMRLIPEPSPALRAAADTLREESALVLQLEVDAAFALPARVVFVPAREGGELAGVIDTTPPGVVGSRLLRLVARPSLSARHGHRPDEELAHFLVESANRLLPGLAGRIEAQRLQRLPAALPSFGVGHYRTVASVREALRARADLRLALAGDWLVAPHLEGELVSGLRAAAELAALSARA
jgi:oxygen-dependent protoporphyrinogen oxidase